MTPCRSLIVGLSLVKVLVLVQISNMVAGSSPDLIGILIFFWL